MSNYNIDELARQMGFNDTYLNKLKASNSYITESANQDRNMINSQLNQTISDYEKERQDQNNNFIKESQAAYVDYAKSINPYSVQNSNTNKMGLGNSGYSESSLINANNTYQNRYTNTKTNYDNIFANINNNIAKAKETGNIELAKIAKQEQDRLLENLYKINDEYTAEKQREEEKRRYEEEIALQKQQWEAEMTLQKQQLAKSSRGSSRSTGSGSVNSTAVSVNNNNNQQAAENQNLKKLYENLSKARPSNNLNKQIYRNLIYGEVQNGHITDSDASALFNEFGL
jgi:hypothetical protein|nr:MAG TPA: hypothetical protein [Caudoviricetes sp.]